MVQKKGALMEYSSPIRVMIVDDHGMVRKGLMAYLKNEPDLEIIWEARDGREALELCEKIQPDVILMDLVMPELGGVAATRAIHSRWSQVQVIALTSYEDKELVQDALHAGAIGYLLKNITGKDLAEAIRSAHKGHPTLAPEALKALIQIRNHDFTLGGDLTRREREVLALLVKGLNNPEIAERLCVSRATIKVHVSNILSKLGASNRAEAISLSIQHKIGQ
jgi:NarL family two-component system response regulator LiaR